MNFSSERLIEFIAYNKKIIIMRLKSIFSILIAAVLLWSCGSSKDIPYIENSQTTDYSESQSLYDATIKPKDDVFVLVNCPTSPEAAAVFNTLEPEDNSRNVTDPFGTINTKLYRVDNAGNIEFPLVGFVKIDGLTIDQAQQTIKDKIKGYFKSEDHFDVYIELPSYSVSVVGEVNRPGMFTITNNKISVFEALARAGDMTIYGVRTDVKLIREQKDGRKDVYSLDITDANIINSPYSYMQQRDILYVQPNEAKSKNADIGNTAKFWIKGASIGISLASLIYSIVK